jgi:uncharacterized protein YdeI (YjbR/CyaY-like superfamily)
MRRIHHKALLPSDDFRRAFNQHPLAKAFFAILKSSRWCAFLYRLHHVTNAEKRAQRIAEYVRLLSEHRTISYATMLS